MIFEVSNLTFRYGHQTALDGVTLSIAPGERVALLGANGSGKSTLLRILNGLAFPQTGSVTFAGSAITEAALTEPAFTHAFRRRVGFVFQNPDAQLFNPTVFDEIAFGPLQLRLPKPLIRERVEAMLEQMQIADLRYRSPHRLSGGEKKRVALASVMVLDPDVLLLDEPTAALDPKSEASILQLLASWATTGKTVILATHDFGTLEDVADRCFVFDTGRVAAEGTPLAILHDVALLERTRLIHPHRHKHEPGTVGLHHPHLHAQPE